jgi:hypothetical protein
VQHHDLLLVSPRCRDDTLGVVQAAIDELVEAVAVALLEGRALRLAMVGEDDDLVRPRRLSPRPLDPAELLV